ncbi:MFS transporter [Bacillus safensis]|nr:MFS transporter [Bacillus safensis]
MYLIAMPLLVYQLTGSASKMGTMYFFETLPILLISLFSGAIVDKYSKKIVMIFSNLVQALLMFLVAALYQFDLVNMSLLYIVGFTLSLSGVFFSVANESIIPIIVEKELLIKVNSIFQLYKTFASLIGPLLSGVLIGTTQNPVNALLFNGFSFLPVIGIVFLLKIKNVEIPKRKQSIFADTKEGIVFVLKNRILIQLLMITLIVNLAHGTLAAMFIFFCVEKLEISSFLIGIIVSTSAGLQIITSLGIARIYKRIKSIKVLTSTQAISAVGILIIGLCKTWWMVGIGRSLTDIPVIFFNIVNRTLRQEIVPLEILGRVNGINRMVSLITVPLAGIISGIIAEAIGVQNLFKLTGMFLLVISISLSLILRTSISKIQTGNF